MALMPLSKSEPCYYPDKWNLPVGYNGLVRATHNCFAYAMNQLLPEPRAHKPQPGEQSDGNISEITCKAVSQFVVKDNPKLVFPVSIKEAEKKPCRTGFYRIALAVNSNGDDYHFMRQDATGMWSHKPRANDVTKVDASGKPISHPHRANWDWSSSGGINYDVFCGYFCVSADRKKIRVGLNENYDVQARANVYRLSTPALKATVNRLSPKLRASVQKTLNSSSINRSNVANAIKAVRSRSKTGISKADDAILRNISAL